MMIIFPLLFILSGKIIAPLLEGRKRWILYILLAWQALSVAFYFPHFLPYTNEFIINKKVVYRQIVDTKVCYREGKKFLNKYLAKHPEAIHMPEKPVAGKVILEINEMLNLNIATVHKYDWAKKLTPVDHINSQYLVFDIDSTTLNSLKHQYR